MKLKNRKTGEIIDDGYVRETHDFQFDGQKHVLAVFKGNGHRPPERVSGAYTSLAELCEEWADAPEEYYYICHDGEIRSDADELYTKDCELIGNHFSTRAEAELAVRKLKALKRLEDNGFKFDSTPYCDNLCGNGFEIHFSATMPPEAWNENSVKKDLTLLFGGEE